MSDRRLSLLIIGAHPDDADYHAGGTAALYRLAGHAVKMVSLTNGDAGHQSLHGALLAERRRQEAAAAGALIDATYDVLDNHDGELLPSLENRRQVIRLIRSFQPDLILTHRPNDYHPDHRYTSQLVQDAAYMVTVPAIVPEVPHLSANPVIAYLPDDFQKPYPFQPAVVVNVDDVFEQIVAMLDCHVSQFYEWLPYNTGRLDEVPRDNRARRDWLARRVAARLSARADKYRALLEQTYGPDRGRQVNYAEAFEACEYGAPLDDAARRRLFPFAS
ncbi:MAG TPA: PIG-L family deacetylase [Gemmataceae bacterium]|jgi:LmbE family N-acetylglucosaminyl deacetylase|nr:PIG-L family deacetylase [Gemmataceae bacterium]